MIFTLHCSGLLVYPLNEHYRKNVYVCCHVSYARSGSNVETPMRKESKVDKLLLGNKLRVGEIKNYVVYLCIV